MEKFVVQPHNSRAAIIWGSPGHKYDRISQSISQAIDHCVKRLDPKPGEKILDVATGTGWTARMMAERGSKVIGVDIGRELIEAAERYSANLGLYIDFRIGDADSLEFKDGMFDSVISTFGVMFSNKPEESAKELARVCKKGGKVALTTWTPESTIAGMFNLMKPYMNIPNPSPPSPFEWGNVNRIEELLGDEFELHFEKGNTVLLEPDGLAVWELFSECYGPTKTLYGNLSKVQQENLKRDFIEFHENFRTTLGVFMPREYLVTIGIKK